MATYIKNNIPGNYAEFQEQLDPSIYGNIGESWDDYCNGMWVPLSQSQILFGKKHPEATLFEVFNKKITVPIKVPKTIDDIRIEKKNQILSYDKSYIINRFYINDIPVWFNKEERSNLFMRINAEKQVGEAYTTIWYNDYDFTINVDDALNMMYMVESYASACFDRTKRHLIAINKLETSKEIEEYDFTIGYPEKMKFNYAKK